MVFIAWKATPAEEPKIFAQFVLGPWVVGLDFGGLAKLCEQGVIDFRRLGCVVEEPGFAERTDAVGCDPDGEGEEGGSDQEASPPCGCDPEVVGGEAEVGSEDTGDDEDWDGDAWDVEVEFHEGMDQDAGQSDAGADEVSGSITGFEAEVIAAALGELGRFEDAPSKQAETCKDEEAASGAVFGEQLEVFVVSPAWSDLDTGRAKGWKGGVEVAGADAGERMLREHHPSGAEEILAGLTAVANTVGGDVLKSALGGIDVLEVEPSAECDHDDAGDGRKAVLRAAEKPDEECGEREAEGEPTAARHGDGDTGEHGEGCVAEEDAGQSAPAPHEQLADGERENGEEKAGEVVWIDESGTTATDIIFRASEPQDLIGPGG